MEFNLYPAQSEADLAFFNQEEYKSGLENDILLKDRSADEARKTYLKDLSNYIANLTNNQIIIAVTGTGDYAGMIWLAESTSRELWDFSVSPGWVYDIRVLPEFRGNGLGHMLLESAEEWATACGYAEIGLHVFGRNKIAFNLYQSNGYLTEHSYLQKNITPENILPLGGDLKFRSYNAEVDGQFTREMIFQQYQQQARANIGSEITDEEISTGFERLLEKFNFGNPKKELIIVDDPDNSPSGVLWFYKSKGDLGKRRYVWLHSALTKNPEHMPQLLAYLEHWTVDNQLDSIRTPVHSSEQQLITALQESGHQPANIFMRKKISLPGIIRKGPSDDSHFIPV
jgi:ribosomal protein S18 acetylase RimI-like enzyme